MVTKQLQTMALEELMKTNSDASFPFLIEIKCPDIKWKNNENQEDGYLRVISDNNIIQYRKKGDKEAKYYYPSCLSFTPPSVNGKEIGNATLSISTIDYQVIEVIRSIKTKPVVSVIAGFMKKDDEYFFSEINSFNFTCENVQWDKTTAQFTLVYDNVMKLQVPKTTATLQMFPACYED